jgi:hypothetical protein
MQLCKDITLSSAINRFVPILLLAVVAVVESLSQTCSWSLGLAYSHHPSWRLQGSWQGCYHPDTRLHLSQLPSPTCLDAAL